MTRFLIVLVFSLTSLSAHAALILNVNTFNSNELSLTISGSFDADVTGDQKDWLAINSDWVSNVGANEDWIADSIGFVNLLLGSAAGLTVIENSITFNGGAPIGFYATASGQNWGDSFYWNSGFDILAGTTVTGTLSVSGANIFDTNAGPFQLVSGFDNASRAWSGLEASATTSVPEPSPIALLGAGVIAFGVLRRKKRKLVE